MLQEHGSHESGPTRHQASFNPASSSITLVQKLRTVHVNCHLAFVLVEAAVEVAVVVVVHVAAVDAAVQQCDHGSECFQGTAPGLLPFGWMQASVQSRQNLADVRYL